MIGFVTGKVYFYDQPDTLQTVGKEYSDLVWNGKHIGGMERDDGRFDQISERCFVDDIFTLVRKSVFDDVGAYETTFFLQCEEWDWQARAKEKGYKIYYTPHAKIWHKDSMTIGKWSPTKAYYDARNPGIVIMKYKDFEFFKRYFWFHTKNCFKGFIRHFIKGQPVISFALLRGYFSMLKWGLKNTNNISSKKSKTG
jgi:hypothetical protein